MTDLFSGPPVRFAVVGLGLMGDRHCQVINTLDQAELVAVYDNDPEVTATISVRHGTDATSSYQDLLTRDDIDAVVLCLPSSLHGEYGILAARAGKHVVAEKPLDSRSGPARRLAEECRRNGVLCAVIHQNRYSPGLASLSKAVSSGLMGTPTLARATVKWFRHDSYYQGSTWRGRHEGEHGGVLINQAVHSIDALQWLFGKPQDVTGYTYNSRPDVLEMEDTAVAVMRWSGGLLATLEASTSAAPGFDEAYEVHSAIASAQVEKGRLVYWYHRDGAPAPEPVLMPVPSVLDNKLSLFYRQYLDILDAILEQPHTLASPDQAVAVVETIERIYAAARL